MALKEKKLEGENEKTDEIDDFLFVHNTFLEQSLII